MDTPYPEQQQMPLVGFESPRPADSLFFALFPDPATAKRIAALGEGLRDAHALRGKLLRTESFHVTLHHLGDYAGLPATLLAQAQLAAGQIDLPAFDVVFDSVASFSGRAGHRPLALRGAAGLTPLYALHVALDERLRAAGARMRARTSFVPHLTLLYDDRSVAPQTIAPIAWTVGEVVLVHSLIGKSTYVPLARWPLRPCASP